MSISLEEAQKIIRENTMELLETVVVNVEDANAYVLAEDIYAQMDQPPFHRSPLDGYALLAADTEGASKENPKYLHIIEDIAAGQYPQKEVRSLQATRIMTGAPIPMGANCVIRQEETDYGEEDVAIYSQLKAFQNYCFQGEDVRQGMIILRKDTKLNFLHIGMLCSQGISTVKVYRRPRVLLITTGDEVVSYERDLSPGKIYNFSHFALKQRLADWNVEVVSIHFDDNEKLMSEYIEANGETCDVIITTGGVSVGRKDILHQVYDRLGVDKIFWRVELKPGSPAMHTIYKKTPIISLSGNPFATLVTFELLCRGCVAKLLHDETIQIHYKEAVLQDEFTKASPGRRFVRAYYKDGKVFLKTANHMSGAIMSMVDCNCYIDIPTGSQGVAQGEIVRIFPYNNEE